jgi:1,5-anhydro-D-fructose reductase (1,5-anhydro-D-mannitol-forming)
VIGWGIAGCGWVARDFVAPALRAHAGEAGGSDLVAAFDVDPARAQALGAPVATTDLDAFLAAPGLQAVWVAAPNDAHRPLVEAVAAAGLPVLCEKPMATSVADARAMTAACAAAGVLYATAHNQRFHPAHEALRLLVAGGALGTVTQARIHYACTAPAWWDADDWHWDPARAGGGALFDLAPHGLDLLAMLVGDVEEAVALRQRAVRDEPVEDGAVVAVRLAGDALGVVQVSYACPEALPRRRLELVGTRAMAIATDTLGQDPGGRLELVDGATGARREVAFDRAASPFARQAAAFAAAVRGEAPWPHPVERDLRTMAVLESLSGVPA